MRIVIATPLYPPEIGGPAMYAKELKERLAAAGNTMALVKFSDVRRYPKLLRHLAYFWRVFREARGTDAVLAFDTWSTGVPALLAAKARGNKSLVRIGGDILWETYLQRTHKLIKLSEFYTSKRKLSFKERLIRKGAHWVTQNADALIFNTTWQKDLWGKVYGFDKRKASVIENEYPIERKNSPAKGRVFVAAGRDHFLKNVRTLEEAFTDLKRIHPDVELDDRALPPSEHQARIRDSYAVVIPSVSEIGPNTSIDAIRYGKPFILPYDNGAHDRLAGAGIFVDTLDADVLRRTMESLLDPGEYARAAERVRAFTFSHSWEEVVKEFLVILKKVCAS